MWIPGSPLGSIQAHKPADPHKSTGFQGGGVEGYARPNALANAGKSPAQSAQNVGMGILGADPFYSQTTGLLSALGSQDAAARSQAVARSLIAYGGVPDFGTFNSPYLTEDVSDTVRELARLNTEKGLSALARLGESKEKARSGVVNDLAARGILQSGETGHQLEQQATAGKRAEYDATQELLTFIQQLYQAFAQNETQRRMEQLAALQDAYSRQSQFLPEGFTVPQV